MKRKLLAVLLMLAMVAQFIPAFSLAEGSPVLDVTAKTHVEDLGHTVDSFVVKLADDFDATGIGVTNIHIENNVTHVYLPQYADGVEKVSYMNGYMTIDVDPFLFRKGFVVTCIKNGEKLFSFTEADVSSFTTDVVDEFDTLVTDKQLYRIYRPDTDEDVPLIIWFHGAGERGNDGYKPLVDYRGAVCWAEPAYQAKHPCAVLVPQIPADTIWDKPAMDDVRAVADQMIAEGGIDASRVYAVGFSAWQATLWFATYNIDFVAAALHNLYWHAYDPDTGIGDAWGGTGWQVIADADLPLWSCISTNDPTGATEEFMTYHVPYQEANNPNFHYSVWTQNEMYSYGCFGFLLHHGWIPTINNQEIIDWLFAQHR